MLPIGYQITLKRLEKGWTQEELARKAGIPQPNLSNIEKGKQDLTVGTLRRIAYGLGVRLIEFFEEEEAQDSPKLSRQVVERIARAVATGKGSLTQNEKRIAGWLADVLPEQKQRIPSRRLHQSWIELKRRLDSAQINTLYGRVQEIKDLS